METANTKTGDHIAIAEREALYKSDQKARIILLRRIQTGSDGVPMRGQFPSIAVPNGAANETSDAAERFARKDIDAIPPHHLDGATGAPLDYLRNCLSTSAKQRFPPKEEGATLELALDD